MSYDDHRNEIYNTSKRKAVRFGTAAVVSLIPALIVYIYIDIYNAVFGSWSCDGEACAKLTLENSPDLYVIIFIFLIMAIIFAVNCIVNIVKMKKNNQWIE